jgi:hypothetical protein
VLRGGGGSCCNRIVFGGPFVAVLRVKMRWKCQGNALAGVLVVELISFFFKKKRKKKTHHLSTG